MTKKEFEKWCRENLKTVREYIDFTFDFESNIELPKRLWEDEDYIQTLVDEYEIFTEYLEPNQIVGEVYEIINRARKYASTQKEKKLPKIELCTDCIYWNIPSLKCECTQECEPNTRESMFVKVESE